MLKQFVEYLLDLLNTARDTRANKEAIADLRAEVDQLASAVERISFELRSIREEERHEREKLLLRMENALLKFECQLPPAKGPKKLK
jgi:chromosome segregation ATPase